MTLRRARSDDEPAVLLLLKSHPGLETTFDASDFCVATEGERIVACGRIKRHADRSLELASVATVADRQGQGIAGRLVEALIANHREPVYTLALAPGFFAKHGFRLVEKETLPASVRGKAEGTCATQTFKAMVRRAS